MSQTADSLRDHLRCVGVPASDETVDLCARYLELLRRWNGRLNLTALPLDAPLPKPSLDRLIVEPLLAAPWLRSTDIVVDLGSGGGSPALPLKIAAPDVVLTLVEARERKCAFLREAVRVLGLADVKVRQARFEALRPLPRGTVVTVRAVRLTSEVLDLVADILAPAGQLLAFGSLANDDRFVEMGSVVAPGGERIRRYAVAKTFHVEQSE